MLQGANTHMTRRLFVLLLGLTGFLVAILSATRDSPSLEGRVVPNGRQIEVPWRTFDAPEVHSGSTIPADTNVVIHLPIEIKRITRKVLFGPYGKRIRYWGYCFPADQSTEATMKHAGLPGTVFLSEAERAEREETRQRLFPNFNIYEPPTSEQLKRKATKPKGNIRHQQEIFYGGTSCYVMTAEPLPIGSDEDGDGLNSYLERSNHTDPRNHDTDGDGVIDGDEVFLLASDPTRRDTDNDGLIDGIEDANRNGRREFNETDPLKKDSDGDGLCDGYCRIIVGGRLCTEFTTTKNCVPGVSVQWRGEDKNLNGKLDGNETDPLSTDTDGDGVLDEQEFFDCLIKKKTDC